MAMLDIPSMPIDQALEDPNEDEDFINPNDRRPMRLLDARRQADGELSDSDDEGEGGRRNHARYRDRESEELNGNHKFGLGGGILNAGSMNTHGAGPSGHTTAVRILSAAAAESAMDVDTPSAESNAGGSGTDSAAAKPGETPQDDLLAKKEDMEGEPTVDGMDMVVEPVHSP